MRTVTVSARVALIGIGAGAVLLAGACTNPFGPDPIDYGRRASLERLRSVDATDLSAFAAPEDGSRIEGALASTIDPDLPDPIAEARAAFDAMERYEITLEEARAAVLENNLDLEAALVNPTIAAETVAEEEGRFESVFTLSGSWSETDSPTATALAGGGTRFQSVTPGLRIPLRTGGTAEITLPVQRFETDNQFATLNPSIETDLQFSLSHNLLRGAGRRATMHAVRIAESNRQISEAQTKLEVIRQIAAAERSYWRLYAAQTALEVRYQQYELARQQLEAARRRNAAGAVAEIEVVRAESGLADRIDDIIQAHNLVLTQQRELKRIVNIPGLDVDTGVNVVPISDPDPVRYEFDAGDVARAALDNRMELLELELRLAQDAAQIAFEKNQALPLIAMNYTYRVNGLGGIASDALEQLNENNFEDWSVGLTAEIPLGNEQRKAAVARSVLTRLQRLSTREAREQSIVQEVHDAIDTIDSGWNRILAGRQSVILNARALEAEQRQFNVGRSTSNDVLDADARLAEARLAELQALTDYQIAQIDLAFATGTLLGHARVDWQPLDPRTGSTESEQIRKYRPISGVFTGD
ncbi:MAG: TolC family protein [Phycisphaerales bacterium]